MSIPYKMEVLSVVFLLQSVAAGYVFGSHVGNWTDEAAILSDASLVGMATGDLLRHMEVNHVYVVYSSQQPEDEYLNATVSVLGEQYIQMSMLEVRHAIPISGDVMAENSTFLLIGHANFTHTILSQASRENLLGPLHNWVVVGSELSTWSSELQPGDRVILLQPQHNAGSETDCDCRSSVSIWRFSLSRFLHVGEWAGGRLQLRTAVLPKFDGFYGKVFRVATLPIDLVNFRQEINGTVYYGGFFFECLNAMARQLKFRYRIVEPEDMSFGFDRGNNTWDGVIGMLQRREADIGVGPFTITSERMEVIDYLMPVMYEKLSMLMRKPTDHLTDSSLIILKPFTQEVWGTYLAAGLGSMVVLYMFVRYDVHAGSHRAAWRWRGAYRELQLFRKCEWYIFGAAFAQGGSLPHLNHGSRTFVWYVWLIFILMIATYAANLTAFLTVTRVKLPVNSLQELVQQQQFTAGLVGNSAHEAIFRTAKSGIYKEVWEKVISKHSSNLIVDPMDGVQKAKDENFIFISEKSLFILVTAVDCNLTMAKEEFFPRGLAFPVQKGSPYQRRFNDHILKLIESGLTTKWYNTYLQRSSQCVESASRQTKATSLTLTSLTGAFFILLIGFVLAALSFAGEIAVSAHRAKSKVAGAKSKVTASGQGAKSKVAKNKIAPLPSGGSADGDSREDTNGLSEGTTDQSYGTTDPRVGTNRPMHADDDPKTAVGHDHSPMTYGDSGIELRELGRESSGCDGETGGCDGEERGHVELEDYVELEAQDGKTPRDALHQKPMKNNFFKTGTLWRKNKNE